MSNIHQKTMNYIYVTHLKHGMRLDNGHNSEEKNFMLESPLLS
jgi:hypothetical protein